jgi:hypothetical protein
MPAKTEYQNQFESQKQKTGKQKKRNETEKNRRRTYLGEAQLAQPNTSPANLPLQSSSSLSFQAARWSSSRHWIHRWELDAPDEAADSSEPIRSLCTTAKP